MGAVSDWQRQKYGGRLQEFNDDLAPTTTAQPLILADDERVSLQIINTGTPTVWLSFGVPEAAGIGIRLSPSGGGVTLTLEDDPNLIGQAIYLITTSGTGSVKTYGARRVNTLTEEG